METRETIFGRRSIRKYLNKPLEAEKLTLILKAAMSAPTARNMQGWRFITVQTQEGKQKIMNAHPYSIMLQTAPCAVIVCADTQESTAFFQQDCAAAIQNMLLTAKDLGLGSVWLGVYPNKERAEGIAKEFSLPENIVPVGIVVLGYGDEEKGKEDRFDPAKVHAENW